MKDLLKQARDLLMTDAANINPVEYTHRVETTVAQIDAALAVGDQGREDEQAGFEKWADSQNYDMMSCHPLHYLFLDLKTYHARQGWKAGVKFAVAQEGKP